METAIPWLLRPLEPASPQGVASSGGEAAAAGYRELVEQVRNRVPGADVDGVLVEPMAPPGVEVLIGLTSDPTFGRVLAFGAGGTLVEAMRDVRFRVPPLSLLEATELIKEASIGRLLARPRHVERVDIDALAELLVAVSRAVLELPDLVELDLNPVIVHAQGASVVDARVVLADTLPQTREYSASELAARP